MIVNLLLSHVHLPFICFVNYRIFFAKTLAYTTYKQNTELFIKKKGIDKYIHFIEVSTVITQLTTNN